MALSWDQFNVAIEDFLGGSWLFRGQCEDRPLRTTLERHVPANILPRVAEQRWIWEFRRRVHAYVSFQHMPRNIGEMLATMQHFGAPTRLLDVTKSPYVAAYFAVEDEGPQDRIIWAFNSRELIRRAGRLYLQHQSVTLDQVQQARQAIPAVAGFDNETLAGAIGSQVDTEGWIDVVLPLVVPYEPAKLSERLTVQQGQFLVMRDVSQSFLENLAQTTNLEDPDCVRRLEFRGDQRVRALERLRLMNITRASLFPGFDGFAQSFRQILIEESPESRVARFDERHKTSLPGGSAE